MPEKLTTVTPKGSGEDSGAAARRGGAGDCGRRGHRRRSTARSGCARPRSRSLAQRNRARARAASSRWHSSWRGGGLRRLAAHPWPCPARRSSRPARCAIRLIGHAYAILSSAAKEPIRNWTRGSGHQMATRLGFNRRFEVVATRAAVAISRRAATSGPRSTVDRMRDLAAGV